MRTDISKVGLGFVVSILVFSSLALAQGFQNVVSTLKDIGVFQFYLPFFLVFAVQVPFIDMTDNQKFEEV